MNDNIGNFMEITPKIFIGDKLTYIQNKNIQNVVYVCATNTADINIGQETKLKGNTLFLNLFGTKEFSEINKDAIKTFIDFYIKNKDKTFILFCDHGLCKSVSLAFLCLILDNDIRIKANTFNEALTKFYNIFPDYKPNKGLIVYIEKFWELFYV